MYFRIWGFGMCLSLAVSLNKHTIHIINILYAHAQGQGNVFILSKFGITATMYTKKPKSTL